MQLQAFHNNSETQKEFLHRVQSHYDADEIIHGEYWQNGKGCAIGCITHSSFHKDIESLYGITEWIGQLIDMLFENMENKYSKEFVLNFAKTISQSKFLGFSNWKHIYHQLCLHILEKECKNTDHPLVKTAISDIISLHRLESTDKEKWSAARSAAGSAWSAAESAAWSARSAARSAEYIEYAARSAAWSAESAAESAAWSARSAAGSAESAESAESAAWHAAESAESAAESAVWPAAESAESAESAAESAARSAAYKSIADKLLELLNV